MSDEVILSVKDLHTSFVYKDKTVNVLNGVNFQLKKGNILGIVGESGSGKSVTVYSITKLLDKSARITGEIILDGENISTFTENQMRKIRGRKISMIFQDPMTALNPVYSIGNQIKEAIPDKKNKTKQEINDRLVELLTLVGISDAEKRLRQYPHELSGGMRQRVVIAMALASEPEILIADEPTTALDVTVQAQILDLIKNLTVKMNMSTILITHDLGIVVQMCDEVCVLYAGNVCERGTVEEIFKTPKHAYTRGLLRSVPTIKGGTRMIPIGGNPVNIECLPIGCPFHPRCSEAMIICKEQKPLEICFSPTHSAFCFVNDKELSSVCGGNKDE